MQIYDNLTKTHCLALTLVLASVLIGASSCFTTGHPMPVTKEVYQAVDPNTQEPAVRLVTTQWSDDRRAPLIIMFRRPDGIIWYVHIFSLDYPNSWTVFRGSVNLDSEVTLTKTHSLSPGACDPLDWSIIDQLDANSTGQ